MAIRPRAVLDTNVFVSGLISPKGPPATILKALQGERFILVSSPPVNDEILKVLHPPRISDRYGLGDRDFDAAYILWELAELVAHVPEVRISSDPDDNKFLATADAGRADYLVTGDAGDLLRLRKYKKVTILSPREFLAVLEL